MIRLGLLLIAIIGLPMESTNRGNVLYHSFELVHGPEFSGDYHQSWKRPNSSRLRFAKCAGGCMFMTWSNYDKCVVIKVYEKEPPVDRAADIVVDCGTIQVTGPVYVSFFIESDGSSLNVPFGRYALRWSQYDTLKVDRETEEGSDHYKLELWPSAEVTTEEVVVNRHEEHRAF